MPSAGTDGAGADRPKKEVGNNRDRLTHCWFLMMKNMK